MAKKSGGAGLPERFRSRFAGLERAHGHWEPAKSQAGPGHKLEKAFAETVPTGATVELWSRHLDGKYGLGIPPLRDDGTVRWGAIDIDVYDGLDHAKLEVDAARFGLPLIIARTKSGGAHGLLFMNEDAPAALVQGALMEWAVALGYAGVEIFPKQIELAQPSKPGESRDTGNWLNMPYYGGDRTTRYAILKGEALSASEFLDLAEKRAVSVDWLEKFVIPLDETVEELFKDGPPCLQSLAARGFPAGSRNNALFNVAVYLRKRYNDGWADHLDEYNTKFMLPPLGHQEVGTVRKSVSRKAYNYKCKDQPIVAACNRALCLRRVCGVGGAEDDPGVAFGTLTKIETDPPIWIWDVDGIRLELDTDDILVQGRFHRKVMERINKLPNVIKEPAWKAIIRERLKDDKLEVIKPPVDATPGGELEVFFTAFVTQRAQAKELDEMLTGRPYTAEGRTYFRSGDFLDYLRRQRVNGYTVRKIYAWFRERKMQHHQKVIKGYYTNYWSVPEVKGQTEDFTVPRVPGNPQEF